jgi:hypothetical protein
MNYNEKELAEEFIQEFMVASHRDDILFERDVVIRLMIAFKNLRVEI